MRGGPRSPNHQAKQVFPFDVLINLVIEIILLTLAIKYNGRNRIDGHGARWV